MGHLKYQRGPHPDDAGWRHSGFNVFARPRNQPREKISLENFAAYLIRSSFSQQRTQYLTDEDKVIYHENQEKEHNSQDARGMAAPDGKPCPECGQQCLGY